MNLVFICLCLVSWWSKRQWKAQMLSAVTDRHGGINRFIPHKPRVMKVIAATPQWLELHWMLNFCITNGNPTFYAHPTHITGYAPMITMKPTNGHDVFKIWAVEGTSGSARAQLLQHPTAQTTDADPVLKGSRDPLHTYWITEATYSVCKPRNGVHVKQCLLLERLSWS